MAINWIFSLKVTLISAGVVTTAVIFHLSLPTLLEFLDSEIPYLRSIITACLKPPYLYILLNCIILTIAASTKLQPPIIESDLVPEIVLDSPVVVPVPIKAPEDLISPDSQFPIEDVAVGPPVVLEDETAEVDAMIKDEMAVINGDEVENEEFVVPNSDSDWLPPRYPVRGRNDKPLVSRRFNYRRPGEATPEGGKAGLGVSKPKRQETLESTWRMITEGRPMPLTRHLKKSDSQTRNSPRYDEQNLIKSENGRVRKESSLSQDELNKRVEAFIKKFNEEMRLQRQESIQHYSHMVGGGHHFQN